MRPWTMRSEHWRGVKADLDLRELKVEARMSREVYRRPLCDPPATELCTAKASAYSGAPYSMASAERPA